MTDFEIIEIDTTTKGLGGEKIKNTFVVSAISLIMIVLVIHRRKIKARFN